ncbi:hypothetical protein [Mycobacterium sp. NAZ190054]|uniref:hypothetical protein n=1 Tax=Mycobacterium sp. NAZ190054 TaxID=1747766 RepID=UPI001E314A2F|nr:hypothetical protein [Mycobacterium sp. NAZ190054]
MTGQVAAAAGGAIEVKPITDADVWAVAEFLHTEFVQLGLRRARAAAEWYRAMSPPWNVEQPNHGYLMRQNGRVIGAYLALYSERMIDGIPRHICNLGVWCVAEQHRAAGLRMLRKLLRQREYTFTDLTPNPHVVKLNTRLGFTALDTETVLTPNLPWPPWRRGVRIVDTPGEIAPLLSGGNLRIYRDHAATPAHHVVLTAAGRSCYVIFRRDRHKGLPVFASILYVSDHDLYRQWSRHLSRYLLLRSGIPATLAELRVVGHRPSGSVTVPGRPKMFLSRELEPDQIDYLYSELTCLG